MFVRRNEGDKDVVGSRDFFIVKVVFEIVFFCYDFVIFDYGI